MTEEKDNGSDETKRLCCVVFAADKFSHDWGHCDQLSNYISRVVSYDKPDPFIFSNLLSTVVNEILEAIFLNHGGTSTVKMSLHASGNDTVITADVPVDSESLAFYNGLASDLRAGDSVTLYKKAIMQEGCTSRAIGFYELAADYNARINVEELPGGSVVRLVVCVCLDSIAEGAVG